jgi:hypothetical protein
MRPKVYVETSVISYLVARRNQRDLLVAANQELTHEWWDRRRDSFDLCISAVVLAEAARGDQIFAAARMVVARELTVVETSQAAMDLANALVERGGLPASAYEDALHIAVAATTGMDYLLTWNCKHIANAAMIPRVNRVIRSFGYEPPLIYTPQELMEE